MEVRETLSLLDDLSSKWCDVRDRLYELQEGLYDVARRLERDNMSVTISYEWSEARHCLHMAKGWVDDLLGALWSLSERVRMELEQKASKEEGNRIEVGR